MERLTDTTTTRLAFAFALASSACGASDYVVRTPPKEPYDAVVVPGCPSEDDGSPSYCQLGRAGHAALLWRHGWAKAFIVSGADVHTPYFEADAIAEAMEVLGVPAENIYLERSALHTDENVYYSLLIAKKLGFARLGVASNFLAAGWTCKMMAAWGRSCGAFEMDVSELQAFMPPYEAKLHSLRAKKSESWVDIDEREERRYLQTGRGRLPSWLLYPMLGALGPTYRPPPPSDPRAVTWADRKAELQADDP